MAGQTELVELDSITDIKSYTGNARRKSNFTEDTLAESLTNGLCNL
jgi:hypothetical protein